VKHGANISVLHSDIENVACYSWSPNMIPWDYLWRYMKSLVHETQLQMVAELIGHIFDATLQIRKDGAMLHRVFL
jgi:hypothetical protein